MGKSSVKMAGIPANQKSNRIHLEKNTNPFTTAFHKHQRGVSEGNNKQKFLLIKGTTAQFLEKLYNYFGTQNCYGYLYGKYKPRNLVQ